MTWKIWCISNHIFQVISLPPSIGYIFKELKIGLISFQLAWLYSIDGAMGQVMVWFSVMPEFFQALELSCTFQFEDHILHQLHQTALNTPHYTKLHQLHQLHQTTPTAPNCTKYTTLHQTTSTTPTAPNYTNCTKLYQLHQTTPTAPNYTNCTKLHQLHQTALNTPHYTKLHQLHQLLQTALTKLH